MGLTKIITSSTEEWKRREMRKHERREWMILIAEVAALAGWIVLMVYLIKWLEVI